MYTSHTETIVPTNDIDTGYEEAKYDLAEHKKRLTQRVRIARSLQHTVTSILSILVAFLQGRAYFTYNATKGTKGTWPPFLNIVPTLMLFITALVALIVDMCSLVAYMLPSSRIGRQAFEVSATGISPKYI